MSHTIETQTESFNQDIKQQAEPKRPDNVQRQNTYEVQQHQCRCHCNASNVEVENQGHKKVPSESERIIQGKSQDNLNKIEEIRKVSGSSASSQTGNWSCASAIKVPVIKMADGPEPIPEEVLSNGIRSPSIDGASDRPEEDDRQSVDSLEAIDDVQAPWEGSLGSLERIEEDVIYSGDELRSRSSSIANSIGSERLSSRDSQTEETFPIHHNEFTYPTKSKLPTPVSPPVGETVPEKKVSKLPPVRLTRTSSMRENKTVSNANSNAFVRTGSLRANKSRPAVASKIDNKRVPRPAPTNGDVKPVATAGPMTRETTATKKRNEKIQAKANQIKIDDSYMTPMQRKDQNVKDLRAELKDTKHQLEERELRLDSFNVTTDLRLRQLTQEKDDLIAGLEISLKDLEERYNKVSKAYGETLTVIEHLEETVNEMKAEMERRDKKHQDMYYEMFERGKATAEKERFDELEKLAEDEPDSVGRQELIDKLKDTEDALERWRNLQRQAAYEEAEKPDTEAGTTLRFLKDSMFHYVTNAKDSEQHLRAMLNIFKYTAVQTKTITKALSERKKGKKSKP